jgi:class 3 adenylate cyclase
MSDEKPIRSDSGGPADGLATASTAGMLRNASTEQVNLGDSLTTQIRPIGTPILANLTVIAGPENLVEKRFPLRAAATSIGRGPECEIQIADPSVSRLHVTIEYNGRAFVLQHCSQTNATFVNGTHVPETALLSTGDEVQLADCVRMRFDSFAGSVQAPGAGSLAQAMQARVELDERIEQRFVRVGTFLDVDVVDSYGMKNDESRSDRVVVSFERFRSFVGQEVVGQRGQVLNSNGDEVMAFFEKPDDAVASARSILEGLDGFNGTENLLKRPFQVRLGAHVGRSAVDLRAGIAYSPVLDMAGHLQKAAPVGGLMASLDLYEALSDRRGFSNAGVVSKTEIEAYVLHPQTRDE